MATEMAYTPNFLAYLVCPVEHKRPRLIHLRVSLAPVLPVASKVRFPLDATGVTAKVSHRSFSSASCREL